MKIFSTVNAYITLSGPNQRFVYALDSVNPEEVLVEVIRNFLEGMGYSDIFPNFDNIRIGTIHPFALLLAQEVLEQPKLSNMFPSITIGDSSSDEDAEIIGDGMTPLVFDAEDLASLGGRRLQKEIYISDDGWDKINATVDTYGNVIGILKNYHTMHSIDLNIWTENKEITSFLFDMMGHFVTQERSAVGELGVTLGSIGGRRSGDINLDFGMLLYGGNLRVQASMNHEAVLFDTAIRTIGDIDTVTLPSYFTLGGS